MSNYPDFGEPQDTYIWESSADSAFDLGKARGQILSQILALAARHIDVVGDDSALSCPLSMIEHIDPGEGCEEHCGFNDERHNDFVRDSYEQGLRAACPAWGEAIDAQRKAHREYLRSLYRGQAHD